VKRPRKFIVVLIFALNADEAWMTNPLVPTTLFNAVTGFVTNGTNLTDECGDTLLDG
jgi:hypothetical protein